MSAIAGVFGLPVDNQTISKILRSMKRRGTGEESHLLVDGGVLLHKGMLGDCCKYPLQLTIGNKRYSIVFDGEIYNAKELRYQLTSLGHRLEGRSHGELMLRSYAQWDADALDKINGVFSVAIWKHGDDELFLARDRMGVKPLFYKQHEGGLLFGSEIKTILAYPTAKAELNAEGAAELLLIGPGRTPGSGIFRGIQELEPGYYGRYRGGKWSLRQYWKLRDKCHEDSLETTAGKVKELVTDAIKRQIDRNESIGALLSGGLDSSIICAVCAEERQSPIHTFSLDYCGNDKYFVPEKFQPDTDNAYIKLMAEQLHAQQHWTVLTTDELFDSLEEAVIARDLPGMADVDSSLLLFSKKVREHVDVVLSGECADEIFGGYPWFRDVTVSNMHGFPWAQNTKYRSTFLLGWITDQVPALNFVNDRYEDSLRQCDIMPDVNPTDMRIKQMANLNHRWFMQTLLDRSDRMSMYHGLQIRVPLCDYRIAEYLYSVPWHMKDHMGREKGLLRYAMKGILPEKILYRKKSPYPKTYDPGYLELVRTALIKLLSNPNEPIFQIVRQDALKDLLNLEYSWPWYGQLMRLPQTIAYMLQINYWLKAYQVQIV